jgi:Na+/proline symporter
MSSFIGCNFNWAQVQRYQSVADERGARKMALLCAVLTVVGTLMWMLPAMAARVIFPDIASEWPAFPEPAEASFVGLALTLLPHGLIGFVVSAILSATLGADNATLNWLSATVTHDLYAPARKRLGFTPAGDRNKLRVARWTMFVLGVLGVMVAFQVPRFGGAFKFVAVLSSIIVGFMMPVGLGLVYRKTPWWSGMAACAAFLGSVLLCTLTGWGSGQVFVRNMFLAVGVTSAVFFASALAWDPADPRNAEILRLDAALRTPVLPPADGGEKVRLGGLKFFVVLGRLGCGFGAVLLACRFLVPSTAIVSSNLNVVAGVLLLGFGWVLCRVGRARRP